MRKEKRRVLAKPIATQTGRIRQDRPVQDCTECAMLLLKETCEFDKNKGLWGSFLISLYGHQARLVIE